MPKKENRQELWPAAGWSALCTLGIYLGLQPLGALLVARESVGESWAAALVWGAACLAGLGGVLVMGRRCRAGRILLGALSTAGFALVLAAGTLAGGGAGEAWGRLGATAGAALAGSTLAAAIGGPRKGKGSRKRR